MRRAVEIAAGVPSRRLGRLLARFDERIGAAGLSAAAGEVLTELGARVTVTGASTVPRTGAVLVVMNHPGAYDAFAMMHALGRDDVALVAAERPFLRAMPHVCEHLVFVTDSRTRGSAPGRAAGLRNAIDWLASSRVLVQFGAGAIEPDLRFARPLARSPGARSSEPREGRRRGDLLGAWSPGTGALAARAAELGAAVVPALVSGVHSPRAMRLPLVRWAERRGVTTIAPLLQAALPGFRDVVVSVRFGDAIPASAFANASTAVARTAVARAAVHALASAAAVDTSPP